MRMIRLTLIAAVFLPVIGLAQQSGKTDAPPAVIQRMVKVTYDVPEDRSDQKGATLDVSGWLVDDDMVLTMWFPKGSSLRVNGKPAAIIKEQESSRLTLLKAALGKRVGQVPLAEVQSRLIGLDEYEGRLVVAPRLPVIADSQFVYIPQSSELTPGAGLFTPDAKLVSIIVAFVSLPSGRDTNFSAGPLPKTIQEFLGR